MAVDNISFNFHRSMSNRNDMNKTIIHRLVHFVIFIRHMKRLFHYISGEPIHTFCGVYSYGKTLLYLLPKSILFQMLAPTFALARRNDYKYIIKCMLRKDKRKHSCDWLCCHVTVTACSIHQEKLIHEKCCAHLNLWPWKILCSLIRKWWHYGKSTQTQDMHVIACWCMLVL